MGKSLCHCYLCSHDANFEEIFIVAWARSRTPTVCACFVVSCFKFMSIISAAWCLTWDAKTLPLSIILSVGK